MKTPRIVVNDIGDIFFLNEQGDELCSPYGSFEPEHFEAFEAIAEACNSHDALVAALEEALEYFEQREDVRDGPSGEQLPNTEMSMAQALRAALARSRGGKT